MQKMSFEFQIDYVIMLSLSIITVFFIGFSIITHLGY